MSIGDVALSLEVFTSILLWSVLAVFIAANLFWLYEVVWIRRYYEPPSIEYGPENVQVRILTIDAETVVQETVDALPSVLSDPHVIAETPMDIDGAQVHVVPEGFDCEATRKGRALEWARRHLPCEREFILFLDEDTIVPHFDGLPDADIVQFREEPKQTGSLISYLSEMYRMGFQVEQFAFDGLEYPLYTWGGGLAVRKSVEDHVTWDTDTVIEDTKFVWRAVQATDIDFAVVPTRFKNQAPPSLRAMIGQRRRWLAGSREEHRLLPLEYSLLYGIRDLSWALSPLAPLLFALPFAIPGLVVFQPTFQALALSLYSLVFVWCLIAIHYFGRPMPESIVLLLVSPLIVVPHAAGALFGLVAPPRSFQVTPKVPEDAHPTTTRKGPPSGGLPTFEGPGSALVVGSNIDLVTILDYLAGEMPGQTDTLVISLTQTAFEWVDQWAAGEHDRPAQVDFVPVGKAIETIEQAQLPKWLDVIDEVEVASDPVYLMILLDRYLNSWSTGKETVIWFDSLTDLLDSVDLYTALGFVTAVTDAAHRSDATVYFHIDPTQHDDRTFRLFRRECDTAVIVDPDRAGEQPTPSRLGGDAVAGVTDP